MTSTSADTTANSYLCEICHRYYKTYSSLHTHRSVYHGEYRELLTCPSCEFTSYNESALRGHLLYVHSKEEIRCKICDKGFLRSDFIEHQSTHKSSNMFTCDACPPTKIFTTFSSLEYHYSTVHACRTCNVCRKQFEDRIALSSHMLNHSESYPFQCKVCFNRYKIQSTCDKHMYEIHGYESCEA